MSHRWKYNKPVAFTDNKAQITPVHLCQLFIDSEQDIQGIDSLTTDKFKLYKHGNDSPKALQ